MRQTLENLILTLCGGITAILTASLMFGVAHAFQFQLYSITFWFILPAGALLTGLSATSGFWVGSKLWHYRIRNYLWLHTLAIALGCYFLIQFFGYWGTPLHTLISFGQYLNLIIQSSTLSLNLHGTNLVTTGELGWWGYANTLVQLLGFAAGASILYALIIEMPACTPCNRYLVASDKTLRYTADPTAWESLQRTLTQFAASQSIGDAHTAYAAFGTPGVTSDSVLQTSLIRYHCPDCQAQHFRLATSTRPKGNEWVESTALRVESTTAIAPK